MKDFVADKLLALASAFNTASSFCKRAAIRVLISRRRRPSDRSDGGLDITHKHTEINS